MKKKNITKAGLGAGGAAPQIGRQAAKRTLPGERPRQGGAAGGKQKGSIPGAHNCKKKQKAGSSRKGKPQGYDYENTFDQTLDRLDEKEIRQIIDQQRRAVYATKTVKAGYQMDVEVYPEFTHLPGWAKRERNRQAQRDLNDKNSRKECDRRVNANFGPADMWLTLSYYDSTVPKTMAEASRNLANYIRRVNYHRQKLGLAAAKVVKVTDWTKEDGARRRRVHCHHHIVISAGLPMEQMLALWTLGRKKEARQLELDERGLSGLAQYITKPHASDTEEIKHKKKWSASKNLTVPQPRKNHQTFKRRKVEDIATQPGKMAEIMEKKYPGYWYEYGDIRYNGHVGLFYVSARLRQQAQPGDIVTISERPEVLEDMPEWLAQTINRARSKAARFEVLAVDYDNCARPLAYLAYREGRGPAKRLIVPARACIVWSNEWRI